jgi:hypothetical protein
MQKSKKNSEGLQENHQIASKDIIKHIYSNGEVERSLLVISKDLGFSRICEVSFPKIC